MHCKGSSLIEIIVASVTITIEEGKTNTDLQTLINQFLSTNPYDPDSSRAYLYKGNGTASLSIKKSLFGKRRLY